MAQQGRGAGSHPDEPPPKRRTLQIKLGAETANDTGGAGFAIDQSWDQDLAQEEAVCSRVAGNTASICDFAATDEEDDDADEDDEDEDAEDEQRLDDGGGSEQDEEDDDDDQDHGQDEGEEQGDGEDATKSKMMTAMQKATPTMPLLTLAILPQPPASVARMAHSRTPQLVAAPILTVDPSSVFAPKVSTMHFLSSSKTFNVVTATNSLRACQPR